MATATFNPVKLALAARQDWLDAIALLGDAPVVRSRYGLPVVIVQDPEVARHVLVTDASSYGRPWLVRNVMGDALGENLFVLDGDDWLRRRRPVAPVFASAEMDGLAAIMARCIESECIRWSPGPTTDIQADVTRLTMRVACQALLGTDPDNDGLGSVVRDSFDELLGWVAHRFSHPAAPPAIVPTPRNRAMTAAKADMRASVHQVVAERRRSGTETLDVLGRLLHAQQNGTGIGDEHIVDECIGFLFAGHETTAGTLTWALYELATHPEAQAAVAAEGDRVDAGDTGLHALAESLQHTGRVVEETLRMYPSGISIARTARRRTDLGGHRIRRNTIVLISVYSMQRSPRGWERPDHFEPDRKPLRPPGDTLSHNMPFGMGPRRCLGARFARTEMRLALAMVCSQWTLDYPEPQPPRSAVMPSLRVAEPLRLHLTKRDAGAANG